MKLSSLQKITARSKKRLGRGIGSGRGKTSGKGTKGQKARGKMSPGFTGGGLPFYKKMPLLRGWGFRKIQARKFLKPIMIKSSQLNMFKSKQTVDLDSLTKLGLISDKKIIKKDVKILASGEVKVPLTVNVPVSKKAKEMIEQAGGKVV